jgi:hypothetical protein
MMLEAFDRDPPGQTSITALHHGQYKQFTRIVADLNPRAHGRYIFVCYSKQAPTGCSPITEVHAAISGERPPPLRVGWEYATWKGTSTPADTNKGAKGSYIYISFKRG